MNLEQIKAAYAYLRVSSRGQVDGDGYDRQNASIEKLSTSRNIKILGTYQDAFTGTESSRPAWDALLEKVLANPDDRVILVERFERIARDTIVAELVIQELKLHGITLVEADSGVVITDETPTAEEAPTRILIRKVLAAIAEFDKNLIVRKLRAARKRSAIKNGRCEGQKPYGFYYEEEACITRMAILRSEGYSVLQIADILNTEGYINRQKGPWRKNAVWKALNRYDNETRKSQ